MVVDDCLCNGESMIRHVPVAQCDNGHLLQAGEEAILAIAIVLSERGSRLQRRLTWAQYRRRKRAEQLDFPARRRETVWESNVGHFVIERKENSV